MKHLWSGVSIEAKRCPFSKFGLPKTVAILRPKLAKNSTPLFWPDLAKRLCEQWTEGPVGVVNKKELPVEYLFRYQC